MGGNESTVNQNIPTAEIMNEWESSLNIKDFYRLIDLVEPQIVNILNDYKYKMEYELLHSNNGDNIFLGTIFKYKYGNVENTIYGNDIYKTQHPTAIDKFIDNKRFTDNSRVYDTYDNWKKFRETAMLDTGYAQPSCDVYWSIIMDNEELQTYNLFELFTNKYTKDRTYMRSSYGSNTILKTYSDIINILSDNETALKFNEALDGEINTANNNLQERQTTYNNVYSNIIFHSYNELITAAQLYYKDTKYKYELYNNGLLGLLDYYIDISQNKHMVYTTIPEKYVNTFNKILYDTTTERPIGNISEDFKVSENKYIQSVLTKRFNNDEKQQLQTVFKLAWKNNYIRLINTYLQLCALVMDSITYNKYFNTTNGYVKTLTDKELSNKFTTLLSSEYLIDEETSVDSAYVYGILSRRLILPISSLKIIKHNKTITFNANRRDLQLKEYYIIQLIRWLTNMTTDTIKLTNDWSVSLSSDLGCSRNEMISQLYLNSYNDAITSIKDLGQPFVDSSFDQEYIKNNSLYINDYNNFINVYTFCKRQDVITDFKTYPTKTNEPNTDKILKLRTMLQQQADNGKDGNLSMSYYAYRINMLINGVKGWSCYLNVLDSESYLISYVLYYYHKKYEKWISKYLSYKGLIRYFDTYMATYHNDSSQPVFGDAVAVFENEPDNNVQSSYTLRVGKMYNFLLPQETRALINKDYGGKIGNIYNKWSLLSCCMECYNGVYKPFYDCVTYAISYYGKWMNLLFTNYIPSQSEDKNNVKKLPLLQETNASLKTVPNQLCSYLFDINNETANKRKILRLVDDYKTEPFIASLLYYIVQTTEQTNISFTLDSNYSKTEVNIALNDNTSVNGFDKKTIKCLNNNTTGNKALSSVLQRCWILRPDYAIMPEVSTQYINMTTKLTETKNKFINCNDNCDEINKEYAKVTKEYEQFIKSLFIDICPFDNLTGIYKTCSELVPNVKILMTITYFLLYRFASSGYNIAGISSKQLPTNSCYMNISELIDTSFNKNVNNGWTEIVNDYNNIINNDIKYCSIDGENVTLSSLISIYMLIFNCKISQVYNNAVRVYYEKYFATKYDNLNSAIKLMTKDKSTLDNNASVIQRGIIENKKN